MNGGTPTSDDENWGGDVAWATPVDLADSNGGVIHETARRLTDEGLRSGSRAVPPTSLIVSTRAPIGYVSEAAIRMAFNQGCRGLVPRSDVDTRFFRYQLSASTERLQSLGQGSTFVELSTEALGGFELCCPPVETQRAIADYLDTETARIDALIAKKRRMIELLEERRWRTLDAAIDAEFCDEVPLRRAITFVTDGPLGAHAAHRTAPSKELGVVRLGNIGSPSGEAETLPS